MNIFVLNTGRCGSTTFIKACNHITNFTSAHESRAGMVGAAHMDYPPNHIEADNRLSWFLGRLDKYYGDNAFYVHLKRNDRTKTIESYSKRKHRGGILRAYHKGILLNASRLCHPIDISSDYFETVTSNIEFFLKDKTKQMTFTLENSQADFREFWNRIGAEGDFDAALSEFAVNYNASVPRPFIKKIISKLFPVQVALMTSCNPDLLLPWC